MKEFKYFAFIPVGGHKPKDLAKGAGVSIRGRHRLCQVLAVGF